MPSHEENALLEASRKGEEKRVKSLLREGVDVNVRNERGQSPLHLASSSGRLDVAKVLSKKGANVDQPDDKGHTPLSVACLAGHSEMALQLIDKKADINFKNKSGCVPLFLASWMAHIMVVILLLTKGARVDEANNEDVTSLLVSTFKGHKKVVAELIKWGANVKRVSRYGLTALLVASLTNRPKMIEILIKNGAEVDSKDDATGWTPLHRAAAKNNKEAVIALLRNGANPALTNSEGQTASELAKDPEIRRIFTNTSREIGKASEARRSKPEKYQSIVKHLENLIKGNIDGEMEKLTKQNASECNKFDQRTTLNNFNNLTINVGISNESLERLLAFLKKENE